MKQGTFKHEIYIEAEPKEIGIISTIREIAFWILKRYTKYGRRASFCCIFCVCDGMRFGASLIY